MPRRGKGSRRQPARTPTGLPYGESQDSIRAQQVIPLPDNRSGGPGPPPQDIQVPPAGASAPAATPPAVGAAPTVGTQPAVPPEQLIAQALQAQGAAPVPLGAPTQRPSEPITAGLPFGPGPNQVPVSTPRRNLAAESLEAIAAATGDTELLQLAIRARQLGLGRQ